MVLVLTALIALSSSGGLPDVSRFILVVAAMLFSQLAIGWSNDYLDRHVDALHQPTKPVPSGLVDARLMPPAISIALLLSAVMGALLGPVPLLLLGAGTLFGLGYNLGIKRTPFGAATFIVAFALLPLYTWAALDVFEAGLLWLYPIGLTLPVAAHVANVLPDLASDEAQGRTTVAVRLGRQRSLLLLLTCQFLPAVLALLSLAWLEYENAVLALTLAFHVGLSMLATGLYLRRERDSDVWAFRLLVAAAVAFAAGWLAAR